MVTRRANRRRRRRRAQGGAGAQPSVAAPTDALHRLWAETLRDHAPRVAVVVGGTGRGKTWAIQRFYDDLATKGPYWQPCLVPAAVEAPADVQRQRKRVVPWNLNPGERPSWLWIGARCEPRLGLADVTSAEFTQVVSAHLELLSTPSRWRKVLREAQRAGVDVATGELLPVVGRVLSTGRTAKALWDAARSVQSDREDDGTVSRAAIERLRGQSRAAVAELAKLSNGVATTPTIVVLDDAHHASVEVLSQISALLTDHDRLDRDSRYFNARQAPARVPALVIVVVWPHTLAANDGEEPEFVRWLDEVAASGIQVDAVDEFPGFTVDDANSLVLHSLPDFTEQVRDAIVAPLTAGGTINQFALAVRIARVREAYPQNQPLTAEDTTDALTLISRLPTSPTEVYEQQLERLPVVARQALAVGGQIGEAFPAVAVCNAVPGVSAEQVATELAGAVRHGLLAEDRDPVADLFTRLVFTDELATMYLRDAAGIGGPFQRTSRWVRPALWSFLVTVTDEFAGMAPCERDVLLRRRDLLNAVARRLAGGNRVDTIHVAAALAVATGSDATPSPDDAEFLSRLLATTDDSRRLRAALYAAWRSPEDIQRKVAAAAAFAFDALAATDPSVRVLAEVAASPILGAFASTSALDAVARATLNPPAVKRWVDRLLETCTAAEVIASTGPLLAAHQHAALSVAHALERTDGKSAALDFLLDVAAEQWIDAAGRIGTLGRAVGQQERVLPRLLPAAGSSPVVALVTARVLCDLGDQRGATDVLRRFPDNPQTAELLARIYLDRDSIDDAVAALSPFEDRSPRLAPMIATLRGAPSAADARRRIAAHRAADAPVLEVRQLVETAAALAAEGQVESAVRLLFDTNRPLVALRAVSLVERYAGVPAALDVVTRIPALHAQVAIVHARLLQRVGRAQEAKAVLEQWHTADATAARKYAELLVQERREDAAAQVLRRFAQRDEQAALAMAALLLKFGRDAEADELEDGLVEVHHQVAVHYARRLVGRRDVAAARTVIARAVTAGSLRSGDVDPNSGGVARDEMAHAITTARFLQAVGDSDGAAGALSQVGLNAREVFSSAKSSEARDPTVNEEVQASLRRVRILLERGEQHGALEELAPFAQLSDQAALATFAILRDMGMRDEAERVLRGALSYDPSHQVRVALARFLADTGRSDEALPLLVDYASSHDACATLFGTLALASGRVADVALMVGAGTFLPNVALRLAAALDARRKSSDALTLLQAMPGENEAARELRMRIRTRQGRLDVVERAAALWMSGNFDPAVDILMEQADRDVKARAHLAEMLVARGDRSSAFAMLARLVGDRPKLAFTIAEVCHLDDCWDAGRDALREVAATDIDACFLLALENGYATGFDDLTYRLQRMKVATPSWARRLAASFEQAAGGDRVAALRASDVCNSSGHHFLADVLLAPFADVSLAAAYRLSTLRRKRLDVEGALEVLGPRPNATAPGAIAAAMAAYAEGDGDTADYHIRMCRYRVSLLQHLAGRFSEALVDEDVAVEAARHLVRAAHPAAAYDVLHPYRASSAPRTAQLVHALTEGVTVKQRKAIGRVRNRTLLRLAWAERHAKDARVAFVLRRRVAAALRAGVVPQSSGAG